MNREQVTLTVGTPIIPRAKGRTSVLVASIELSELLIDAFSNRNGQLLLLHPSLGPTPVTDPQRLSGKSPSTTSTPNPLLSLLNQPQFLARLTAQSSSHELVSLTELTDQEASLSDTLEHLVAARKMINLADLTTLTPTTAPDNSASDRAALSFDLLMVWDLPNNHSLLPQLDMELALSLAAVLLFAYFLALMFALSLTRPLNQVLEATEQFAKNGYLFEGKLPTDAKDEIGKIARAFSRLFDQVQSNYANLDSTIKDLVEARTQQLIDDKQGSTNPPDQKPSGDKDEKDA